MAGKSKRQRRRINRSEITMIREIARQRRHKKYGHSYTRSSHVKLAGTEFVPVSDNKRHTIEDEYRTYRKSKGRRGLTPNPDKRGLENWRVRNINSIFNGGRFPIGELLSKPIDSGRA